MKRLLVGLIAVSSTLAVPMTASAQDAQFPEYTGPEFQALYAYAIANTLPNLDPPNAQYSITGNEELDQRIRDAAFERGYVLSPTASENLGRADGVTMQPQAAEAWRGLKADARAAGMPFIVSSAYRSLASQRTQFLSKLGGTSDSAINAALTWWSIPGTSKHHAGYALDFRYRTGTFGEFRNTPDYAWLKEQNFATPKQHGLIPSYPDDVDNQGPNPEPWEFVWIGTDLIQCGIPQHLAGHIGPAAGLVADIGRCPGGVASAELPTWLLES